MAKRDNQRNAISAARSVASRVLARLCAEDSAHYIQIRTLQKKIGLASGLVRFTTLM